ncbi:MAG: helix-turn-helix domain-containing protein [Clostridia bacterium]|nr:helix-turn-helix domain-containing protein [Clostridia bacterium]
MREKYEKILGSELRYLAIETRDRLGFTQKEMSDLLQMGVSSYSDIETGKYSCGALTEILLLCMQDDPQVFLEHINEIFLKTYEKEME